MSFQNYYLKTFLLFLAFILTLNQATASDLDREKRLVAEIEESILDGDGIWLEQKLPKFFAIYTEAEEDPKGTVILLHGRGLHPDWSEVISPLRVGLTEHNWNTLSLQLPVLAKDAKYNDYVPEFGLATPRINSAIEFIRSQSKLPIVLLSHSCGAHMATEWIEEQKAFPLAAYIGISVGATDFKQPMLAEFPYDKIKQPVLDIYGELDTNSIRTRAAERSAGVLANNNPLSKQIKLEGADHYYKGKGDELTEAVADWLSNI